MYGDSSSEYELNENASTNTSQQTTSETPTSSGQEIDLNVLDSIPSELIDEQFRSIMANALHEDNPLEPSAPGLTVNNNNNNQPMSLPSDARKRKRKTPTSKAPNKVWVYEGTGDIYTGLPPSTVTSTKNHKRSEVLKGQVEVEGQTVTVEYITKKAQKKRQKEPEMVWVYEGTGDIYTGLPPSTVTSTKNRMGGVVLKGQVEVEGQTITVEYITKAAQKWRQKEPDMVWVYEGTGNIYTGLPPSNVTSTRNHKRSEVMKGQVEVQGQAITVEYITKKAQTWRQKEPDMVWVYEGTGNIHAGLPPSSATSTKNHMGGEVLKGQVEVDGQTFSVEYITKHAQKKRQKEPDMVWVYEGTGDIYTGLPPSAVTSTKNCRGGEVQKGLVEIQGQIIFVEYITKHAQKKRQKEPDMVWVYEGTGNIYTGLPPSNVILTKISRGQMVQKGQVEVDGQIISVEYITKHAQTWRQKEPDMVWVYEGTGNIYTGLPPSNVILTKISRGQMVQKGQVEVDGQAFSVEYITKAAQKKRQKEPDMVWVYKGTGDIYTGLLPSTVTSTKNNMGGEVQKGQVEVDGQTFSVEYITKKAQKKRQKEPDMVWVYEGTGDIYTGLPPSTVTSTKNNKGGEVLKGRVEVEGQAITVEYITKQAQTWRQQRELKQQPQPKKRKRDKENNAATLPINDNHPYSDNNREGDVEMAESEQGLSDEQAYSQQGFNDANTLNNELNGYVAYSPYGFFAQSPPRLNQQDNTLNTNTELQDSLLEEAISSFK
ncbi:hypothetical protein ACQUW5_04530 [Legionella sp. CNM-1927-20]|uniref:hypothetical protein n=2 Tax=Legionella sp. CNM-1927-20 TaxID=3422221 RepID=UPI00403B1BF0